MQIPNAKVQKLDNGITLVTEEISSLRSISIGLVVGAGADTEEKDSMGISHFIEHTTFKGTNKRNAFQIAQELDRVGGKLNAFTGKEYTVYYAIVQDNRFEVAADVLSDIFLNSKFNESDIEMERGVILEEIKMYEDTPDEQIHDISTGAALPDHPLGNPVIGTNGTVSSINREKINAYRSKYYTPDNLLISVAGNVSHKKTLNIISSSFGEFDGKKAKNDLPVMDPVRAVKLKTKKTEQVHLIIGSKGASQNDEERFALTLLDNILGGSMSSHLFQEVREKRGLAYSIYSFNQGYKGLGLFGVYAGTSKENFEKVIELILKEMRLIKNNGITKEELERSKEYMKGTLVLGLETSNSRMNYMAKSVFYHGRVMPVDEMLKNIDNVSPDDIISIAGKYFMDKYLNLSVIGDFEELPLTSISIG